MRFGRWRAKPVEEPIRSEIFGIERLEQHAESLAAQTVATARPRRGRSLLKRLEQNHKILRACYTHLIEAVRRERLVSPAAEWLIDNFYLVEDQLREIREDLPENYYRQLPKIAAGFLEGYPRVYGLAWANVAHTDSRFDPESLRRFVRAYQNVQPLTIGELWAVPISLRLVLIENLRRLAEGVVSRRLAREEADGLADSLLGIGRPPPSDVQAALRTVEEKLSLPAFSVRLFQRLRDMDPGSGAPLQWLRSKFAEMGTSEEEIVGAEHLRQAETQVSIQNVITSMRSISSLDWAQFFETVSLVDEILASDEADVYAEQDFETCDRMRHAVEEFARGTSRTELEIAREAVTRAAKARSNQSAPEAFDPRAAHCGFYLISEGRRSFEKEMGYRPSVRRWVPHVYLRAGLAGYLGTIAFQTALMTTLSVLLLILARASWPAIVGAALLGLIPFSELAFALLNRDIGELLEPRTLPKLAFENGVPASAKTLVAFPFLLTQEKDIREQVERLEVCYLANSDGDLRFALLTDWIDAPSETTPDDDPLLATAVEGIAQLNQRHGPAPGGEERFFLFHRRRLWNGSEGQWMGWERKRGKLHELNTLLRGATDTTFLPPEAGPIKVPAAIRYVITLDADTRMSREGARRLVGTIAHPLNRANFDPAAGRVVKGYGIVQPRISPVLPPREEASLFQRIYSGPMGIDPYVGAVSDVYQDLFGEGTYTGKGIYDVDAFEAALAGRIPDNALLSHDLFEGCFARAGLSTDIVLFEEFPNHSIAASSRRHRWARGDWQLLPWLLPYVPDASGRRMRNPMSRLCRWKILDNLRRTLYPPSLLLWLMFGWLFLPVHPVVWLGFVLLTVASPSLASMAGSLVPKRRGVSKRGHLAALLSETEIAAAQILLSVVLLADRSVMLVDAIVRTLARITITGRHRLEWVTAAAQTRAASSLDLASFYRQMAGSVAIAFAAAALLLLLRPDGWPVLFVPALWAVAPVIARQLSLPGRVAAPESLTEEDAAEFRETARRTWSYFETHVTAEDHGLPPDNFQEDPTPVLAHRTSPTNIGLYILATVAARDLGWIGTLDALRRIEAAMDTVDTLEKHRGHLLNWYATRDLRPLEPRYISTVDSGNLAACLLTLASACREIAHRRLVHRGILDGLEDTLLLATPKSSPAGGRGGIVTRRQLDAALADLRDALSRAPDSPGAWCDRLREIERLSGTLCDIVKVMTEEQPSDGYSETLRWAESLRISARGHRDDLESLFPWARLLDGLPRDELPTPQVAERWKAVDGALSSFPTLASATEFFERAFRDLSSFPIRAAAEVTKELDASARACASLARRLEELALRAERLAKEMDFGFLFDPTRKLFAVGYHVDKARADSSFYDLLASEARIASFIAVAKEEVPVSHWFRLGRPMTPVGRGLALQSWSGSMFEYLMPSLLMQEPAGSLLDDTARLVVRRHIEYGKSRGVPWGISESAYSARDASFAYQYAPFGGPGLGLKRGLGEDLVVAPYATMLAAMVAPRAAARNLKHLSALGALGPYGFYEALDFTSGRVPEGARFALVRAYMTHHQGMSIVALANVILDGIMRERFHAQPMIRATELLLQERPPLHRAVARTHPEEVRVAHVREIQPSAVRRFDSPHWLTPRTHILSNGQYSVMLTTAGSGYSRCGGNAVTRWREDATRDDWGSYIFLRDGETAAVWSAGYQPIASEPDSYEVSFGEVKVDFHRRDGEIATGLEIVVSPEDNAELRRLTITNAGSDAREIEVTTYSEIVLAPPQADEAHPAFSNLFVQTDFVVGTRSLIATRRPRLSDEKQTWAAHVAAVRAETLGAVQFETDRARFLGRNNGLRNPAVVMEGRPLSNTTGCVLDPVFSLRYRIRVPAGETAQITFSTLCASSRDAVEALADKYNDPGIFERAASLAWTRSQVEMPHLRIEPDEAQLFQRLANRIVFADPFLRSPAEVLKRSRLGQRDLWAEGISGDLPIVLLRVDQEEDRAIVRQLIRAHEYWQQKGLAVDLVILNEHPSGYLDELHSVLESLVHQNGAEERHEPRPGGLGGVHLKRADHMSAEIQDLLRATARVVIASRQGTLLEQLERVGRLPAQPPPSPPTTGSPPGTDESAAATPGTEETAPGERPSREPVVLRKLDFFNGLGGFADDGREYVIALGPGQRTPMPWINVIANPSFGFQVSETGAGATWAVNSRENRLTPWSNDPVTDPSGEAIYVCDLDTGALSGPSAWPIRDEEAPYVARHGQGWSRFEHTARGITMELLQLVPIHDPVKISRLRLTNLSGRDRRLSVTAYVEWVLGFSRDACAPFLITEVDSATGAVFATNTWNQEFSDRVGFLAIPGREVSLTCDRSEFIGRNGTLSQPAALARLRELSGRRGAGLDPCAAVQTTIEVPDGGRAEVTILLGEASGEPQARELLLRYRQVDVDGVAASVVARWEDVLGALTVKTPDVSMNFLLNRWLLYQALSCRVWARSAFYQSSGAYGFRDQLQDVMALTVPLREITQEHLLRAASRQYVEGDVQHWWHEPAGRGVRTRCSDDLLWLPFAVLHYLDVTADALVLDKKVPFITGPPLPPDKNDDYHCPETAAESGTLYDHCARALNLRLEAGPHGLPLMGTGDWNDGMNRVGEGGKGESVWLGWFLHMILEGFAQLAQQRGDAVNEAAWRARDASLLRAMEEQAWDGDWYIRAFFDNGQPLGSARNEECRIDSIAQSWSVISGAAEPSRAIRAMEAVEQHLVRRGDGLVLLFTPPFDKTLLDPGYIKGYPPGVRENGGQYTHGALWAVFAFAMLGDSERAAELFGLLNPINHTSTRAGVYRYKVEPYVAAADVYGAPPHTGRGGWTWYTGSAGWMYRAGIEAILGFRLRGETLVIDPCIPRSWPGFQLSFRYHSAHYELIIDNPQRVSRGVARVEMDGAPLPGPGARIPLADDGMMHDVRIVLG